MKLKVLKWSIIVWFLCAFAGTGCSDDNSDITNSQIGYITGWFVGEELGTDGKATGKMTPVGYCILLETSEIINSGGDMDFYTFDFPDSLFSFLDTDTFPMYNPNNCGPVYFPDSIKVATKFRFNAVPVHKSDKLDFTMRCNFLEATFIWEEYEQVTLSHVIVEQ